MKTGTLTKCLYLAASSSSSSLTNCLGMFRDRTLSAICSSTRRWFPSVVGKRYILDIVPPNTEATENPVSLGSIVLDYICYICEHVPVQHSV